MAKENKNKDQNGIDIKDKLVAINRVTKVVKGGRRFGFAALVVAGDESGKVGFGHGKAKEVPEAIKKATDSAKKSLVRINAMPTLYSHSIVPGGLLVISKTTRFTPFTSFTIRVATRFRNSCANG